MSEAPSTAADARVELYDIMRREQSVDQKIQQALDLGAAYLDVDNAHLTRIDPASNYWEAIASTDPEDGEFPPGLVLDYQTTYCRRVLADGGTIALHDAPEQGWADDPAFEAHGLHCYHGTPITVDGAPYGTVCFVATEPRAQAFDEADTMFAELVARLIEHELERQHHHQETARRANSVTVLSRVLRHNLRNDMTVVRGHVGQLAAQLDDDPAVVETLYELIDEIIALSDKARKLETVVSTQFDREPVALAPLLDRVVTEVSLEQPAANVAVAGDTDVTVEAMPSLELALTELVENAAKHATPDPTVSVEVAADEETVTVTVADDGPGLPDSERAVLAEGVETPLVHGSGLGLWMVYWIVTSHDGTIDITTTADGTTVTVALPRVVTEGDGAGAAVRALERTVDRFEAVFEEAFDAMVIVDDDRRIIDANAHAADLFGCEQDALLGRTVGAFAADHFDEDAAWQRIQAQGHDEGYIPLVGADDDERVVAYSATADIVPGQHLLVGRDVTERRRRERRFEALSKGFPDLCFIIDEDGVYREVLASDASEDQLYVDPETFLGEPCAAVLPDDVATLLTETIAEVLSTGEVQTIEYELSVPAGDRRFEATLYPLSEPIEGRQAVSTVVRDVTDRR